MAHYRAMKIEDGTDPRERLKLAGADPASYQPSEAGVSALKFPEAAGRVFKLRGNR